MKLIYTEQSIESLEDALNFVSPNVSHEKLMQIRDGILNEAEILIENPLIGQNEPYLEHLNMGHRRIIKDNYEIISKVIDQYIYITDIFDTRQDPEKMKG